MMNEQNKQNEGRQEEEESTKCVPPPRVRGMSTTAPSFTRDDALFLPPLSSPHY